MSGADSCSVRKALLAMAGFADGRKKPRANEYRKPLEAGEQN